MDGDRDLATAVRVRSQLLASSARRSTIAVVRRLVAIQAQIPSATALAVRARSTGLRGTTVSELIAGGGGLSRTWLMRGTIHVVTTEDAAWLRPLLAPILLRGNQRRYGQLGLTPAVLLRSVDVLAELVAAGPRSRSALRAGLSAAGIAPDGQRAIHLIQHAALHGALTFAADRDGETAWGPVPDGAAPGMDPEAALAELARRYVDGYGPADARDLAAWSGLPVLMAREAWQLAGLVDSGGRPSGGKRTARAQADGEPVVRLLPHFDPYLLGYRTRDHVVPPQQARTVWTGGGFVLPTVVVDGRAVATWRNERRGGRIAVSLQPFGGVALGERASAGVGSEIEDIRRFLGD